MGVLSREGQALTGLKSFRLSDVPTTLRQHAKSRLIKQTDSITERIQIGLAADQPSDRLYFIPMSAWDAAVKGKR